MVKLYEITEAQAEAMSAATAAKVLAQQKEREDDGYGEAWNRELAGYALEYGDDGKPKKDSQGDYVVLKRGYDVPEAPTLWHHWSKILSKEKMMELEVGEALSLHPEVKKILKKKVDGPLEKFKENASEKTKSAWERASETVKATILGKWLRAKGHHDLIHDGGRRKTRRSRGRRTTRKH